MSNKKYIIKLKEGLELIKRDKFEEFKSVGLENITCMLQNRLSPTYRKYLYILEDFGSSIDRGYFNLGCDFLLFIYAFYKKKLHLLILFYLLWNSKTIILKV